jgi:hypothetical protein
MLYFKDNEGGQKILESSDRLNILIKLFDDQMNVLKNALTK